MADWWGNRVTGMENVADIDARIILIHPHFLQQHTFFVQFLDKEYVLYIRLDGDSLNASEVEVQISEAQVNQEMPDWNSVHYLIIDEADRIDDGAFSQVLKPLLELNTNLNIVISSRVVPSVVLNQSELRTITCFIPVDASMMLTDYPRRESRSHLLEVRSFGTGQVFLNGEPIDQWDGVLPRSLFFYFIDRGMTTRDEIFATFWPELSVREATNVFHVTKRKISEILSMDLTVYWSGFYRLSPEIELSYDSVIFSEAVQDSAVASEVESAVLLKRAVGLYRGDFLTSLGMEWADRRRRELRQTYAEALIGLAKSTEKSGQLEESLGLYIRAAATNPQREDLARGIMNLYHQLGHPENALDTYHRLEKELEVHLGVAPAPQLQALAKMISAEFAR